MTKELNNKAIKVDGAYLFLRRLDRKQRIPRYRPNGLPSQAEQLSAQDAASFDRIGAPDTLRNASK